LRTEGFERFPRRRNGEFLFQRKLVCNKGSKRNSTLRSLTEKEKRTIGAIFGEVRCRKHRFLKGRKSAKPNSKQGERGEKRPFLMGRKRGSLTRKYRKRESPDAASKKSHPARVTKRRGSKNGKKEFFAVERKKNHLEMSRLKLHHWEKNGLGPPSS